MRAKRIKGTGRNAYCVEAPASDSASRVNKSTHEGPGVSIATKTLCGFPFF